MFGRIHRHSPKESCMKHTRSTVVGATALLAAGLVGVAAPAADAQTQRITSAAQLQASIGQAVALEKLNPTTVAPHPAGRASQVEVRTAFCSAD
jgi:hypothetical protein